MDHEAYMFEKLLRDILFYPSKQYYLMSSSVRVLRAVAWLGNNTLLNDKSRKTARSHLHGTRQHKTFVPSGNSLILWGDPIGKQKHQRFE